MKKALITGAGGFVGSYLTKHLIEQSILVSGIYHPLHPINSNVDTDKVEIIKCDVLKKEPLKNKLKNKNFDYVLHLAAFSSPAKSLKNPKETLENNIMGELNLLQILNENNSKARILIIGSADEYGDVDKKYLPINEDTPLNPDTPYAVSKVAQDLLGFQFFLHHKMNIVRVRPFNHTGPGQSTDFAIPSFAAQIAKLEKAGSGELRVGNTETYRDFTDVRDMVRAYLLAVENCKDGDVYNIGAGKAYKISDILKKLIKLSKVKIRISSDKRLFRKVDILKKYCNYSKFNKQTGWKPSIPIEKTLSDTIEYERSRIKQLLNDN